ncbi:condensation domain-containing protein, partial [Rheinheimera gaetbuli]
MGDLVVKDVLLTLIERGITFEVSEGKLRVGGALETLDEEARSFLKRNKSGVLQLIEEQNAQDTYSIKRRSSSDAIPLSFAQQRLWLLEQIDGGSALYNMPNAIRLSGTLDFDALNGAFSTIVHRHESLRTCFAADHNGEPYQSIQSASDFKISYKDVSSLPTSERQVQVTKMVTEQAQKVFDLSTDIMLRVVLVTVSKDEYVLLVTMHHIAADGWSMALLIDEFTTLYSAFVADRKNPLLELDIQYADYAIWQRDWLRGEVLESQLTYWQTQLADLPETHSLPLDRPRPKQQSFAGSSYSSQVDLATSNKLKALCQENGATLYMGLHAAFSTLLSCYSNETDIVLGTSIANREQAEISNLIGFFLNTLVLRSDLTGSLSFVSLLLQSKKMLLEAYSYQQVPFELVVERLQPERSLSQSPLFQIMLVLQNNEQGNMILPGLILDSLQEQRTAMAKYDLTLNVSENTDGLYLGWEYNTDLFDSATIEDLSRHFITLLVSLLEASHECVFKANLLSESERAQQLVKWNQTHKPYSLEKSVHRLFEEQVER